LWGENQMSIFGKKAIVEKKEVRKGHVFVTTDQGTILPFPSLKKFEIKKASKQIEEEKKWMETEGLAARPYPPDSYLILYESNPIFFATVNQIAMDVAGIGWRLVLKEGAKENKKEQELIEEFLHRPNERGDSLRKICKSLLVDWGTQGYFALEVVRNNGGKVSEIYHVPAYTLWVHTEREKFRQKRGVSKKVWFKQFGLEENFSSKSGEKGEYGLEDRANELIFCKTNYPKNDYYGVPNVLPAVGSVLGLIGIRDFNLSFFTNYGVPAYLVTLTGEWEDDAQGMITKFLNTEVKGSENAHKTLVLQTPEGGTATFKPLSVDVKEGSFRVYQQVLREDVLAAYSMPAYRIGINIVGKLGGSNIQESTVIYNQSVVEPLQEDLEDIINNQLIEQGLDCHSYLFKFNDMDLRDLEAEVNRYNSLIEHGAMTPNEARNRLDLGEPYSGGDRFYMSSTLVEIGEAELEKRDKEQIKFMGEMGKLKERIEKAADDKS